MRSKVTVVGAGNVGATTAQRIFDKGYADVVLVDIVEGLPQGKALDMLQAGPPVGSDASVVGTNGYEETAGSDIVVVTSGIARKPGMSRDDLLLTNMKIVTSVVREVAKHSPDCILMPVTNPLDAMAQRAFQVSGFPKHRVVGMAGILDTSRFRTFLALELGVSVESITAYVLGGHGDTMVPIVGSTTVGGTAGRRPAVAGAPGRDREAHPGRRRGDRRPAENGQRLLRPLGGHRPDGRVGTAGQEAGTPLHRLSRGRVRHRRPVRRRARQAGSQPASRRSSSSTSQTRSPRPSATPPTRSASWSR